MIVAVATIASMGGSAAHAAQAPAGQGFTVTPADLAFILKQIKIAEHHAATYTALDPCGTLVGPGPNQIPDRLSSYGLRTVDGTCNNLFPGRETFSAADQSFPRLTNPVFRNAEGRPAGFFGPTDPGSSSSSYAQKLAGNLVYDTQPRIISNLIVDQTSTNPAAIAAAAFPVRSQNNPGVHPCTTDPDPFASPPVDAAPVGCVPSHQSLFIPNVTTDVGLSPPYNSLFTFFGQFFDHGVDQTVKSGGTVFVPLKSDDPLIAGPDHILGNADDLPPQLRFMVLTRAQNQPGPDGVLGTADDIQNANNTDTPWVDQSQTYTSHASHQVFLREYAMVSNPNTAQAAAAPLVPVSTGMLLGGMPGNGATGMATWQSVKAQAASKLGLLLKDTDVTNIPMIAADPYGKFIPGPLRGLPQYVTKSGLVEGNLATPVPVPADVLYFDTPFLTDIAHNADPGTVGPCTTAIGVTPRQPAGCLSPDADNVASADFASQPAGTYDDEMLNAHFCAGDGRVNENIALTTIHQIFHSEHDRLVTYIKGVLSADTSPSGVAALAEWKLASGADGWNGERLFQAARFVTEMEYQHLVFEEFARKVQPAVRPFHVYHSDINAAIPAEFAHAVYRFGHSMLDDQVARTNVDPVTGAQSDNSLPLLTAFLNPPEYFNGHAAGTLTPEQAAGSVVMGSSDQVGNELDEFVVETLRNNLLGLPLDLATLNLTRARDAGVPPLNELRRQIFAKTNDGAMAPYTSWSDLGQHLKHPESLVNFVAAYGTHPTIVNATTLAQKRAAAKAIVDPTSAPATNPADIPADAADFMFSTGAWASDANGVTTTGLDSVDLWIGGLAEVTNLNGGLLGSTFNYVFQNTLENLQDGDRLYYLARTPGMNLRAQLEGNSFAELIQRNTEGTSTLKADAFATADCKFQLANLSGTPAGFTQFGSTVADDPSTPGCDESLLLIRSPDGTISYRLRNSVNPTGINGQAVYNGTPAVDRIKGGVDNDTFWGGLGNDIIDGNGGDDVTLGGDGNDIITDLDGADVLKGGPGNDAIDGGPGNDIVLGGDGQDFTNGGSGDNETFGGPGTDFINAGQGADAVFGDGGDDWIQGGSGQDLLQGDHGAPFFDDPAQVAPGNDVFVGQVGENDYDAEGGDDIMSANAAIDRFAGAGGFDWATHQYDTIGADDDMAINNFLLGLPIQVVVNRDRWQETEANSGSAFNDVIKGDNRIPVTVGGAGFNGCDALDQAGIDRIAGLDPLIPPLNVITTDVVPASQVAALSVSGYCPLSGNVWGGGNIILGGGGSDTIEGRGANDIIDGDKYLNVRISVRTNPADPSTEIGSTDLMEHQYKRDATGNLTGNTLQQDVFNGTVDPGNLVIVREILSPPASDSASIDTAVFSGLLANYTITPNADGSTTVTDNTAAGGGVRVNDGVDTLWNIEVLQFSDQTFNLTALTQNTRPTGTVNLTTLTPTQGVALTATRGFTDAQGVNLATLLFTFQAETAPGVFTDVATGDTFTPTQAQVGQALRVVATFVDGAGVAESVTSGLTAPVANVNDPPVGVPTITPATAAVGTALTASTAGISDADGLVGVTFTFQWQQQLAANVPTNIAGATGASFTPTAAQVGRSLRVVVSYVDNLGTAETVTSASTNVIGPVGGGATVPGAPGIGTAQRGGGGAPLTAIIRWTAPAANGGSAITGYRVTALRMSSAAANATVLSRNSSALLGPGVRRLEMTLAAGTYRFEVVAVNARGASLPSARSNAVVPR